MRMTMILMRIMHVCMCGISVSNQTASWKRGARSLAAGCGDDHDKDNYLWSFFSNGAIISLLGQFIFSSCKKQAMIEQPLLCAPPLLCSSQCTLYKTDSCKEEKREVQILYYSANKKWSSYTRAPNCNGLCRTCCQPLGHSRILLPIGKEATLSYTFLRANLCKHSTTIENVGLLQAPSRLVLSLIFSIAA